MNAEEIRSRVGYITGRIDHWQEMLDEVQENCPHENVDAQKGGNTGNYDQSADCYWTDFHCHDCDKQWTVFKE